jgi:hypothetical protein
MHLTSTSYLADVFALTAVKVVPSFLVHVTATGPAVLPDPLLRLHIVYSRAAAAAAVAVLEAAAIT